MENHQVNNHTKFINTERDEEKWNELDNIYESPNDLISNKYIKKERKYQINE